MAARPFSLFTTAALLSVIALTQAPRYAGAQSDPESATVSPEVPNAKFNFVGEVSGNNVYIRSGPSDSYYPTSKLQKGNRVTVRGAKFDYLKIEPPEGSFSYVGKAYVERRGDGSVGRVTTAANVRTGSDLNSMKTTVQTKLEAGTDVRILAEQDEYYKIDPPPGAYLYVKKDFVAPVERIGAEGEEIAVKAPDPESAQAPARLPTEEASLPLPDATGTTGAIADAATGKVNPAETDAPQGDERATTPTTTQTRSLDATADARTSEQKVGATRPADSQPASAETRFDQLEGEFEAASLKPIVEQPVDDLLTSYQALVRDDALPESLKRMADARIGALKIRRQTREEFAAVRKGQDEANARRQALQAERQELEEQIRQTQVEFFAAVGTLRTSSLQQGPKGTTLYRLTDPQSGRTLVYVRSADREFGAMLNQLVGVKGEMKPDPLLRMKVITPTETKPIDPTKVGSTIAAAVLPASLLRNTPTVSTESAPIEGQ